LAVHRVALSDEIAAPIIFLSSTDARLIIGHLLNVDGGYKSVGFCRPWRRKVRKHEILVLHFDASRSLAPECWEAVMKTLVARHCLIDCKHEVIV
jgi:hypothetical protein